MKQKVIKLKKSDLVNCNSGNKIESGGSYIEKSELEALVRKIVRQELIKKGEFLSEKRKSDKGLDTSTKEEPHQFSKMTKTQLEEVGRKSGIELDRRKTKLALIKELKAKGIK